MGANACDPPFHGMHGLTWERAEGEVRRVRTGDQSLARRMSPRAALGGWTSRTESSIPMRGSSIHSL
jgi:hypothetical protein